jgi:hypothetical protein
MNTVAEIKSSGTKQKFILVKTSRTPKERNVFRSFTWTQTSMPDWLFVKGGDIQDIRYTHINKLINFNYTLRKPIKVKIIKNLSGEVIGDIEELELYSFGDDEFEVLRELNEELTDLFEDLLDIADKNLGEFPQKWKSILQKYINKV